MRLDAQWPATKQPRPAEPVILPHSPLTFDDIVEAVSRDRDNSDWKLYRRVCRRCVMSPANAAAPDLPQRATQHQRQPDAREPVCRSTSCRPGTATDPAVSLSIYFDAKPGELRAAGTHPLHLTLGPLKCPGTLLAHWPRLPPSRGNDKPAPMLVGAGFCVSG